MTNNKQPEPAQIDWDDPAARADLIERVGPERYSQLPEEHMRRSTVAVFNGYPIRQVSSRFGRLFAVDGANKVFLEQEKAEEHARSLRPNK